MRCNITKNEYHTRHAGALDFDDAELGALSRRRHFVDGAVCMSVVAEVEGANDLVRVMHYAVM